MVTKLGIFGRLLSRSLILAKIHMVTKQAGKKLLASVGLILAKIHMDFC